MGWWGKVIGGGMGFWLGGILGALLGLAIGHGVDNHLRVRAGIPTRRERVQTAFFTACFSIMGHLAKADGRVSETEIELARQVMQQMRLDPEKTKAAQELFRQGKADDFPLDEVLDQFRQECGRYQPLIAMLIEIQVMTVMADGRLDPAEKRVLGHVAEQLGINRGIIDEIIERIRAEQVRVRTEQDVNDHRALQRAYGVLAVPENASDDEVKRSYRKLISQHHPDKLVSKGLPEEMMEIAKQQTQEIKAAYELIKRARQRG